MEDESDAPQSHYPMPGSAAKLSKTPSWVMLGFLLGAFFVYAWMRREQEAVPSSVAVRIVEAPRPAEPRSAPVLTTIEAVFDQWREHAVWFENTTQVALWSKADRAFSDFYEVRRIGGLEYFRSIPELTRRVIRHGRELPESPLQFTETEEQYQEWREHGRTERRAEGPAAPARPRPAPAPGQVRAPSSEPVRVPPPALPPPSLPASPEEPK